MTNIKKFRCGLCKKEKRISLTRHDLRKHLREEHRILNEITNIETPKGLFKQKWWIAEDWE